MVPQQKTMRPAIFLFFSCILVVLLPTSINARPDSEENPILLPTGSGSHLAGLLDATYSCKAWQWGVETNLLQDWKVVPSGCVNFIKDYMVGGTFPRYQEDVRLLVSTVAKYLISIRNTSIITQAIVFDLSDTLLSNLPYYQQPNSNFGGNPFDPTNFNAWVEQGTRPAVPYMAALFNAAVNDGFQAVVLTGSSRKLKQTLIKNLEQAGYTARYSLLVKSGTGETTKAFKLRKRKELVENSGYTIVANIGDQWRDLAGPNEGNRTFKVPNPMYYLG